MLLWHPFLFDLLMTKIIIEPKVGLVDVTMHPLWNFQSIICPQTKISLKKVIFVILKMSPLATKLKNASVYVFHIVDILRDQIFLGWGLFYVDTSFENPVSEVGTIKSHNKWERNLLKVLIILWWRYYYAILLLKASLLYQVLYP